MRAADRRPQSKNQTGRPNNPRRRRFRRIMLTPRWRPACRKSVGNGATPWPPPRIGTPKVCSHHCMAVGSFRVSGQAAESAFRRSGRIRRSGCRGRRRRRGPAGRQFRRYLGRGMWLCKRRKRAWYIRVSVWTSVRCDSGTEGRTVLRACSRTCRALSCCHSVMLACIGPHRPARGHGCDHVRQCHWRTTHHRFLSCSTDRGVRLR